jgi:hypothetical protein
MFGNSIKKPDGFAPPSHSFIKYLLLFAGPQRGGIFARILQPLDGAPHAGQGF